MSTLLDVQREYLEVSGYKTTYASEPHITINDSQMDFGRQVVEKWARCHAHEETWVQIEHGVPSLLVRLDCVRHGDGLRVYEVEDRPAGAGISSCIDELFRRRLQAMQQQWGEFRYHVISPRKPIDDYLWLAPYDTGYHGRVLLRSDPDNPDALSLQRRSVSTVTTEGDKSYGEPHRLGWWRKVSAADEDNLPWDTGFALKRCQGTHCKGVHIWVPKSDSRERSPGQSSRSQIRRELEQERVMYCQDLIRPEESLLRDFRGLICRIFYGYEPKKGAWSCLGGLACVRSNLRNHGASDSLLLPLHLR